MGSKRMTSGIHHFTGITANVQANVDFYVGFLGHSLVKQTGGYADAEQLHLIYGDGLGSPGSLLTLFGRRPAVAAPASGRSRNWHWRYRQELLVTGSPERWPPASRSRGLLVSSQNRSSG